MPSFNIHLAVAIKYCEKNVIKNKDDFFEGSIAPDLVKDKSITHYTGFKDTSNLKISLSDKSLYDTIFLSSSSESKTLR